MDGRRWVAEAVIINRPMNERNQTRGSTIAERPARRYVSVEILVYCYTNNASRSRVSLIEQHFQQLPRAIPLPA